MLALLVHMDPQLASEHRLEVAQHLADTSVGTEAVPSLPQICSSSTWACWVSIIWLAMQCYGIVGAASQTL